MKAPIALLAAVLVAATASSPLRAEDITGTVMETMNSGGYTYLRLKTPAGEKWAAVTQTAVKKGTTATIVNTMEMKDFESPTLKRKFDSIAFGMMGSVGAKGAAKGAAAPAHGARAAATGPIKVAKAAGPDARTIAEVYAQKKELEGKETVVSGKIVKLNSNILDRNWAHLRDGSGSEKDGSDDLTVILKDEAALGQIITARGKVVLNKDLGGMYKFAVVLEDASLVK